MIERGKSIAGGVVGEGVATEAASYMLLEMTRIEELFGDQGSRAMFGHRGGPQTKLLGES